jgi:hypothetical protein
MAVRAANDAFGDLILDFLPAATVGDQLADFENLDPPYMIKFQHPNIAARSKRMGVPSDT